MEQIKIHSYTRYWVCEWILILFYKELYAELHVLPISNATLEGSQGKIFNSFIALKNAVHG